LRYIELPIEVITHTVFHELANKCPNLTHMLLDFSTAMQLHDFSEMQVGNLGRKITNDVYHLFLYTAGVPHKIELYVHLPLRGYLYGGFHEENL
jgi:hypothetical protein